MAGEAFVAASLRGEQPAPSRQPHGPLGAAGGVSRARATSSGSWSPVVTDDEWRACCDVLGRDDLAGLDLAERQARHDELDEVIAAGRAIATRRTPMETLQAAGVPAGRVLDTGDDPRRPAAPAARGFWVYLPHPQDAPLQAGGRLLAADRVQPDSRPPQPHSSVSTRREVLAGVGGLSDDEIDSLYAAGITADAPVNPEVG